MQMAVCIRLYPRSESGSDQVEHGQGDGQCTRQAWDSSVSILKVSERCGAMPISQQKCCAPYKNHNHTTALQLRNEWISVRLWAKPRLHEAGAKLWVISISGVAKWQFLVYVNNIRLSDFNVVKSSEVDNEMWKGLLWKIMTQWKQYTDPIKCLNVEQSSWEGAHHEQLRPCRQTSSAIFLSQ